MSALNQDHKLSRCYFCWKILMDCVCPDDEIEPEDPYDDSEPYEYGGAFGND